MYDHLMPGTHATWVQPTKDAIDVAGAMTWRVHSGDEVIIRPVPEVPVEAIWCRGHGDKEG